MLKGNTLRDRMLCYCLTEGLGEGKKGSEGREKKISKHFITFEMTGREERLVTGLERIGFGWPGGDRIRYTVRLFVFGLGIKARCIRSRGAREQETCFRPRPRKRLHERDADAGSFLFTGCI